MYLSPFLNIGITLALLQFAGTIPISFVLGMNVLKALALARLLAKTEQLGRHAWGCGI